MSELFEDLCNLDRLVHSPPRLAILTALLGCERADFMFLLNVTGLSRGNLSTQLRKLEEARLIRIRKSFKTRRPRTEASLTALGRRRIEEHWRELERLREDAEGWRAAQASPSAG